MEMKKSLIIISTFISILIVFSLFTINASTRAYSIVGKADSRSIELSKKELNNAKDNCEMISDSFSYLSEITYSYEVQVYHFEAPANGYFAFYTTGPRDMIIKVYEHQNFLWWTTGYDDVGYDDDSSRADTNSCNASVVTECERYEDYYVCVRRFSSGTGEYTLNVEPNEDKMHIKYNQSYWECDNLSYGNKMTGVWTSSKNYLNKYEVLLLYWSLDPACQKRSGYSLEYVSKIFSEDSSHAIDIINFIISTLLSLTDANKYISITYSVIGNILNDSYKNCNLSEYEMMQFLAKQCGVDCGVDNIWTVSTGLVIKDVFISESFRPDNYYFETYTNDVLVGEKYEKGSWSN